MAVGVWNKQVAIFWCKVCCSLKTLTIPDEYPPIFENNYTEVCFWRLFNQMYSKHLTHVVCLFFQHCPGTGGEVYAEGEQCLPPLPQEDQATVSLPHTHNEIVPMTEPQPPTHQPPPQYHPPPPALALPYTIAPFGFTVSFRLNNNSKWCNN